MARTQIQTSDHARTRYLKRFYKARWDDPELYDVMINTANLTVDTAALMVCKMVEEMARG
jgi:cytidylate kinase